MTKLFGLFILLFSIIIFSPTSFAEWKKMSVNHHATFYVNFETIRKVDGYVNYWELGDLFSPIGSGVVSVESYSQGDCKSFRTKTLSRNYYKKSMARGTSEASKVTEDRWISPSPKSPTEIVLKSVCAFANKK